MDAIARIKEIFSQAGYAYVVLNHQDCDAEIIREIERRRATMVHDLDMYWAGKYVQHPDITTPERKCPRCKRVVDFEWYDNNVPSSFYYACEGCKTFYIEVD